MREMKDSGIEWIGKIPVEWSITPLKHCSDIIMGQSPDSSEIKENGTTLFMQGNREFGKHFPNPTIYCDTCSKHSRVGDILMSVRAPVGSINMSDKVYGIGRGLCSIQVKDVDQQFLKFYLMKSVGDLNFYSNGSTFDAITTETLREFMITVPPRKEQRQIADFLNDKCTEIDSVLTRTRASIDEYKKLKQAVITEAVTKGVRGKRPMKDSGVEWIGTLPMDWSITALKYCASLQSGITLGKNYPKGAELIEIPYLRVANVQGDHVDLSDVATIQVTAEEIEKYALHDGELLMTEGGDRDKLGRGTIWHGEIDPCIHQNHVFAVETDESKLLVRYFDYVTSAAPARTYFDLTAKKTTNLACTNSTTILRYRFALPPITEQHEIVDYLDTKCAEINKLIAKKEQYLVELENYKKSLIYEYVTGKKEVPADV